MIYKHIIRPILFLFNPETIHNITYKILSIFNNKPLSNVLFKLFNYTSPYLKQKLFNIYFRTPIGLTAGMDKNAALPLVWGAFNFSWAQLGSVTYLPQKGNPKPRLWRLVKDRGLIVYYGLSNIGAEEIKKKLKKQKKNNLWSISIAKSNDIPLEKASEDCLKSFKVLEPFADIVTINLSCPNVKNFTGLQKKELLEPILLSITENNINKKPIWLKIGIDLNKQELDNIIYLVKKYNVDGIIATNLSKDKSKLELKSKHKDNPGGISGRPMFNKSNKTISYLFKNSENKYKIIGVGGIFTAEDAYTKIKAGSNLLQIGTGFIYNGPFTVKNINKGLVSLLKKDNFKHISQAIGIEANKYSL